MNPVKSKDIGNFKTKGKNFWINGFLNPYNKYGYVV